MRVKYLFVTILLSQLFFASNCFAQTSGPPFNFNFQDTTIPAQDTGCVEVVVSNFTDVASFEFAFIYDDTKFEYTSIESSLIDPENLAAALSPFAEEPTVTVVFFDLTGPAGISLPDSSIAFSLCFQAIGEIGDTALIDIPNDLPNGNPSRLFTATESFLIPDFNLVPSTLTIGVPPFNFIFQDTTIPAFDPGCVDVVIENFVDVFGFEFAFGFDGTKFEFLNLESTQIDSMSLAASLDTINGEPIVSVVFFSFGELSLPDNTIAFSLCFHPLGEVGDTSSIEIFDTVPNGNPTQIFTNAGTFQIPDFNLVSNSSTLTIGQPLIISVDSSIPKDLRIYPNPVQDKLYLESLDQNWNYQILNIQGQKMTQGLYQDQIDVKQLPSGIYFLQLQREGDVYEAIKFVKE